MGGGGQGRKEGPKGRADGHGGHRVVVEVVEPDLRRQVCRGRGGLGWVAPAKPSPAWDRRAGTGGQVWSSLRLVTREEHKRVLLLCRRAAGGRWARVRGAIMRRHCGARGRGGCEHLCCQARHGRVGPAIGALLLCTGVASCCKVATQLGDRAHTDTRAPLAVAATIHRSMPNDNTRALVRHTGPSPRWPDLCRRPAQLNPT